MRFCDDTEMAYDAARRSFAPGEALTFDDAYRLAHLPLVAPGHPETIASVDGKDYRHGRYDRARYALVAPLDAAALAASEAFQAFEAELRALPLSDKIAWGIGRERTAKLHATIVGGLAEADVGRCAEAAAGALGRIGNLALRIGGPFLGRINTGRIYLPVYPCRAHGEDAMALVQQACGARPTRFYVAGYYHFAAALTVAETSDLARLAERWRRDRLAELALPSLAVMATNDDLALSGRFIAMVSPRVPGAS